MKAVLPIVLFSLISIMAGCQSVYDIKFTTSTRGYNKEIVVSPKTISLHEQNFREPGKEKNSTWEMRREDWKKITESLDGIMLREIPLLKAPSDKRTYDGARASMLSITDKKGKIWHHSFDDEDPNEALKPLMKLITDLSNGK
jgi:hypothetical protein